MELVLHDRCRDRHAPAGVGLVRRPNGSLARLPRMASGGWDGGVGTRTDSAGRAWHHPRRRCRATAAQSRLSRAGRADQCAGVSGLGAGNPAPSGAPVLLGDVVLAFETVAQEAAEQEKSFGDHLRHLVVHGVLHLLGYDHLTHGRGGQSWKSLETSILAKLGVPDPYRDPSSPIEPAAVRAMSDLRAARK